MELAAAAGALSFVPTLRLSDIDQQHDETEP